MRKLDPQFGTVTLANRLKFKRCPSVILERSASKNRVPLSLKKSMSSQASNDKPFKGHLISSQEAAGIPLQARDAVRFFLAWIFVLLAAAGLRFFDLADAPMHADEAVGARITANRIEGVGYHFDPRHHHGPTLSWIAAGVAKAAGLASFQNLDETILRVVPAACGTLVVLLPLLLRRWLGDRAAWIAGLLLATSPLLCQFSRVFIHEPVLVLFSGLALACLGWWLRGGGTAAALSGGLALGLMAATKETFGITAISWLAGLVVCRGALPRQHLFQAACWAGGVFLVVVFLAYGGFGEFFSTYFLYTTDPAHAKPLAYYWDLLVLPKFHAPQWWSEGGVALLAIAGAWAAWKSRNALARVLAVSTAVQFFVLSLISYKTPWLAVGPWIQTCLLAGWGAAFLLGQSRPMRFAIASALFFLVAFQIHQVRAAVFRFPNDVRNPMAYSPTSRDVIHLADRLRALRDKSPVFRDGVIAVLGTGYWPLPWYLRETSKVGYFETPPPDIESFPVVIAMPESALEAERRLSPTHKVFYNGLRSEVPVAVFVRQDVYNEEQAAP